MQHPSSQPEELGNRLKALTHALAQACQSEDFGAAESLFRERGVVLSRIANSRQTLDASLLRELTAIDGQSQALLRQRQGGIAQALRATGHGKKAAQAYGSTRSG